ncbi:MAG: OmpA family protein [Candidatus Rokubacteria bacterium]|nr:OmpA family protein [Candidatus Rokubacteria bacterium]MBI3826381.1 OmpA family protein [Candidatus Rokubacteria bacterium]
MRQLITIPTIVVAAAAVALTGCATRGWVRQLVGQTDAKVQQTDARVTESRQRLEGMGDTLTSLEGAVTETGQMARAAQGRADEAYGRADEVDHRLTRLWNSRNARTAVETVHVHFGFDRTDLDDGAQTALLTLVEELEQHASLSVDVEGYTDLKGSRDYNVRLSHRRAEAVRLYLVERGVELPRIHFIGRGPLGDPATPPALKRRVTVRLVAPVE